MARTLQMDQKELREARIVGIPEQIIGKLAQGIEPSEREKNIINKYGKEYVSVHSRNGVRVRPHLRDLSGGYSHKTVSPHYGEIKVIWLDYFNRTNIPENKFIIFDPEVEGGRAIEKLRNLKPQDVDTKRSIEDIVRNTDLLNYWLKIGIIKKL